LIVVFKKLLREDEYEEWERGHKLMNEMNKDSLLVAETYEKEYIKKYFTCCECPADYEMSVLIIQFRSFSKDSITFTRLSWPKDKPVPRKCGIKKKSFS
jgi:hypothetical protein